jgi:serine/threonine-protein kinase
MPRADNAEAETAVAFRLGEWTVEPSLNRLTRGENSVQLEPKAMDVLVFLARHPGEVLPREAIIDAVWAEDFVGEGVLRRAITVLREALGDDAKNPSYIETISKRGYRLIAEVARADPGSAAPAKPRGEGFRPRWIHALAVAVAVIIGLLVVLPPEGIWQRLRDQEPAAPEARPRIVVLPFENLGPPEDEYFADGMTDEIISRLTTASGLEVIWSTSAMYYKGSTASIDEIARELGVEYVLEGAVRWSRTGGHEGRVRITPKLIAVADGRHIWSDLLERDIGDIFTIQGDIARQVIDQLEVTLLEAEGRALEVRPTENMEAYEAYLRGIRYEGTLDPQEAELAITMFERAVSIDPDFALSWALLAQSLIGRYWTTAGPSEDLCARAKAAIERALDLDPDLPEASRALGSYYGGRCNRDFERALEALQPAAKTQPNNAALMSQISLWHRLQGRWQEALVEAQRAVELDPKSYVTLRILGATYVSLRRYGDAVEIYNRAISLAPDRMGAYSHKWYALYRLHGPSRQSREILEAFPRMSRIAALRWVQQEIGERKYEAALERMVGLPDVLFERAFTFVPTALMQCECYARLGDRARAREACESSRRLLERTLVERPDDPGVHAALGRTYALLGREQEAVQEGKRAVELLPVAEDALFGPDQVEDLARIFTYVGEVDAALDRIDYLLSIPSYFSAAQLRLEPYWDPLRDHPRFAEILEKYGEGTGVASNAP